MNYWTAIIKATPIAEQVIKHFNGKVLNYEFVYYATAPRILFRITERLSLSIDFKIGNNLDQIISMINDLIRGELFDCVKS